MWVPHRFGALGLVLPSIEYTIPLSHEGFAFPSDIVKCGPYSKYGMSVHSERNGRSIQFPSFIPFAKLQEAGLGAEEIHFWPQLVRCYADLDDQTLDALASCRTATATVSSLWAQVVFWSSAVADLAALMFRLGEGRGAVGLQQAIGRPSAALGSFRKKVTYWQDRDRFISTVRGHLDWSELQSYVPVVGGDSRYGEKLECVLSVEPILKNGTLLVHTLAARTTGTNEPIDAAGLESAWQALKTLGVGDVPNLQDLITQSWSPAWRDSSRFIVALREAIIVKIESTTGLPIPDGRGWWEGYIRNGYPLPSRFVPIDAFSEIR